MQSQSYVKVDSIDGFTVTYKPDPFYDYRIWEPGVEPSFIGNSGTFIGDIKGTNTLRGARLWIRKHRRKIRKLERLQAKGNL